MPSATKGMLDSEGKTKCIYVCKENNNLVYVESKDRITAGDGVKAHDMKDKAEFSNRTNSAIFNFLNSVGVPTSFVASDETNIKAFIARRCEMIPIEWVTRRIATGSFLKRHPNVKEGFRFAPIKLETFFKDDANHDPFWSLESIKDAQFKSVTTNKGQLNVNDVERLIELTKLVFELLERAWQTLNHSLVDMKVEFGWDVETKQILLSDVIDNDSWRLWPNGDKRLMLDKQVYRNLDAASIDSAAMEKVRSNFAVVAERTENLFKSIVPNLSAELPLATPQVGIIMGSRSDSNFCLAIVEKLNKFGINRVEQHIASAHKSTEYTVKALGQLNQWTSCKCIIAVAGRSNGLGLVAAANSVIPVINCPPISDMSIASVDIWSSLRTPSGMGCSTVLGAECAAMAAAQIVANDCCFVWSKLKTNQVLTKLSIIDADIKLQDINLKN